MAEIKQTQLNNENCESICMKKTKLFSNSIFLKENMNKFSSKYLGIYMGKTVNFKDHIQYVLNKTEKFSWIDIQSATYVSSEVFTDVL